MACLGQLSAATTTKSVGLQAVFQGRRHWSPYASCFPAHKNPLLLLPISLNTHSGILNAINEWVQMELIVTLTVVSLPALFIKGALQVGMLAEI